MALTVCTFRPGAMANLFVIAQKPAGWRWEGKVWPDVCRNRAVDGLKTPVTEATRLCQSAFLGGHEHQFFSAP